MHSFVFSFLEKMVNPAMILLQSSQAAQMSLHAADHSWNASKSLQENSSIDPLSFFHCFRVVFGKVIKAFTRTLHCIVRDSVLDSVRLPVGIVDPLNIFKFEHRVSLF